MKRSELEIAQNLRDAGCDAEEILSIVDSWREGNLAQVKTQIAACRRRQLARMHDSQKCIDRLDYLSYMMIG